MNDAGPDDDPEGEGDDPDDVRGEGPGDFADFDEAEQAMTDRLIF